jgi:hypothetical protein
MIFTVLRLRQEISALSRNTLALFINAPKTLHAAPKVPNPNAKHFKNQVSCSGICGYYTNAQKN